MATLETPVFSLQAPKDISIDEIESELRQLWEGNGTDGANVTRAATFTLVVYEPEETQQLLAALKFYTGPIDGIAGPRTQTAIKAAQKAHELEVTGESSPELLAKLRETYTQASADGGADLPYTPDVDGGAMADAIAAANPCRIITLCPIAGEDSGVKAQVSAYCPIDKRSQGNTLVCCEYITLTGTAEALDRIGGLVSGLVLSELPYFMWWKATPDPEYGLFHRLARDCNQVIIDSSAFKDPEADLQRLGKLKSEGISFADLNWRRLSAWQELTAEAFDPPDRRDVLPEVDRVTVDYERGNQAQALMYLSWLASRLQWTPVAYEKEGGDYEIRRVTFTTGDRQDIQAELAAIPVADSGTVQGDLISLRLSSTNLNADCCTVLCSATTGCMRMEAGGGAQSCRIQQVTPLFDQKTDLLLKQQLQSWHRDSLYEESTTVMQQILALVGE